MPQKIVTYWFLACSLSLALAAESPSEDDKGWSPEMKAALYSLCVKQKNSGKELAKGCAMVGVEPPDSGEDDLDVSKDSSPCACQANGDTLCEFSICGFDKGRYRQSPGLNRVAQRVSNEVNLWPKEKVNNIKFEGQADPISWLPGSTPLPRPIPLILRNCVEQSLGPIAWSYVASQDDVYKDRLVAALRGCALRLELIQLGSGLSTAVVVKARSGTPNRCASLSFSVIDACKEK